MGGGGGGGGAEGGKGCHFTTSEWIKQWYTSLQEEVKISPSGYRSWKVLQIGRSKLGKRGVIHYQTGSAVHTKGGRCRGFAMGACDQNKREISPKGGGIKKGAVGQYP